MECYICAWLIMQYAMKAYGEWMYRSKFSTSRHQLEVSDQLYSPGERVPGTHSIRSWVETRVGLGDKEKWKFFTLPGLELRAVGNSARSQ
jgi:hypothetical protein